MFDVTRLANDMALDQARAASHPDKVAAALTAWENTDGDAQTRMVAALRAVALVNLRPEPVIDLPATLDTMSKQQLKSLADNVGAQVLWVMSVPEMRDALRREALRRQEIADTVASMATT